MSRLLAAITAPVALFFVSLVPPPESRFLTLGHRLNHYLGTNGAISGHYRITQGDTEYMVGGIMCTRCAFVHMDDASDVEVYTGPWRQRSWAEDVACQNPWVADKLEDCVPPRLNKRFVINDKAPPVA